MAPRPPTVRCFLCGGDTHWDEDKVLSQGYQKYYSGAYMVCSECWVFARTLDKEVKRVNPQPVRLGVETFNEKKMLGIP